MATDPPRLRGVPAFVLTVSLLFTAVAVWYVYGSATRARQARFDRAVLSVVTQVARRLDGYVNALHSTSGFIDASSGLHPQAFAEYVDSLDLPDRYPGIQGIGFAKVVRGPLEEFEQRWRDKGIENFHVWPSDPRESYAAIVMLEPRDERNLAALGYDMMSNPIRQRAMVQARDTASAATSGRVSLVQEITDDRQHGFLIYVPIYGDPHPRTVLERRERVIGFAYGAFRTGDFFGEAIDLTTIAPVRVEIYDGIRSDPDAILYESAPRSSGFIPPAQLTRSVPVEVPGRTWTLVVEAAPALMGRDERTLILWTLIIGVVLSLVLWIATLALARERVIAENRAVALRESETALRESQSKIRRLVDANIIGVMTMKIDGTIEAANDEFLRILGYSRSDPLSGTLNIRELMEPDEGSVADFGEALPGESGSGAVETTLLGNGGRRVPVLLGATRLDSDSDEAIGFIVDISDRRRAEEERDRLLARERELRAAAETANVAKDEFLATLSHELRTPMTAILGWAKMLDAPDVNRETIMQGIDSIRRSAQVQAQLIDDLLDVSRIMVGKLRLVQTDVDLRTIIEDAIGSFRHAASARGIELLMELPDEPVIILGDEARLQQVVWNLVSNALKFTTEGSVRVALTTEDDGAILRVTDTGVGMDPDFVPHVFDRFRQADATSTRAHGGLGLGLSIVKTITELHGGHATAHSDGMGNGATFTVTFPLARAGALRSPESSRPRRGLARDALHGLSVLLVEDNLEVRQMVDVTIRRLGASVTAVGSVDEALENLEVRSFDVVVSDIAMPTRDGFDLIRTMRRATSPTMRDTPAIALTAHAGDEFRERLISAGFAAVVSKPVDADVLAHEILDAAASRERP